MAKPKQIINDPKEAVGEFVQGLLKQFPNKLVKLQNHNVLLKSCRSSQVQLLSGGGSGHEPSHAGWVGDGMLTGAILGGMFASPSVAAVLSAIRCAAGDDKSDAVLLIVKNYTGDRLNFGMACERANLEGIDCQMVVVADDCALERSKGITGARGVAGTVLVHKIAGAAASMGMSLSKVCDLAKVVCSRTGTMGIALNAVTVPGAAEVNDRLDENTIEIGLGIHGEAGMKQSPMLSSDEMAKELLSKIEKYGREISPGKIVPMFEKGDSLCLLVNNLGGSSNFELSILANSAVQVLEKNYGCKVTRLLVGSFMTSFNMHGASLTVLNLTGAPSEVIECLDATTTAPAWIPVDVPGSEMRPSENEIPEMEESAASFVNTQKPELEGGCWENPEILVRKAATALAEAEPMLTKYDTIVGDGDCGITMKRGAEKVLAGNIPTDHPVSFFASLADAVSASMGGTSGVLLELMFSKMASQLSRNSKIGAKEISNAFRDGVQAVSLYGGATVGARTMLDALFPAANELVASGSLKKAADAARAGANSTATMKTASAGRSNYLSEATLDGTPDPGAVATAVVLDALSS